MRPGQKDFDQLEGAIKEKLEAYLAKENVVLSASGGTRLKGVEGLESYEIMVLVTIGENLSDDNDGVSPIAFATIWKTLDTRNSLQRSECVL